VREIEGGDERRVGARFACDWRGRVAYPVRFDFTVEEVDEPGLMSGRASGAVEGAGTWRLVEDEGITRVTYAWEVRLTRAWMKVVPHSVLAWNHDWVMRKGGEGIADRLGTTLLEAR